MNTSNTPRKGKPDHHTVNLALQGGGSHGAFTWGVLDALLEDGRVRFEGVSGTSAGAMNAVALAHGLAQGALKGVDPNEAARESLANFWNGIVAMGAMTEAQRAPFELFLGCKLADAATDSWVNAMSSFWGKAMSPYQMNPFDLNPLRNFLEQQIDFAAIAKAHERQRSLKVFVVATRVSTGKAEVFSGKRLTVDAVMASACLPQMFKAVEIEGDHFWDGGYSGNPAMHPLIYHCEGRDIVLVQINPIQRDKLPTTAVEIADRVNEVTFNAGLIAEMRAIDFVSRLVAQGKLSSAEYKDVLMHRIDGGEALEEFAANTKTSVNSNMIHSLRELGVRCAKAWLKKHFDALGVASSVNIRRDYLDDLRVPVKPTDTM